MVRDLGHCFQFLAGRLEELGYIRLYWVGEPGETIEAMEIWWTFFGLSKAWGSKKAQNAKA